MHLDVDYRQRLPFAGEHLVPIIVCAICVHASIDACRIYTVRFAFDRLRAAMANNTFETSLTYANGHNK